MVKSNINALGIIFPNYYDSLVPELVNERLMAFHSFCKPLPSDRFCALQHGKLRHQ